VFAEVAPGILVRTSRNDVTTSTVVVGPDHTCLLIDPAWDPDELEAIAAELATRSLRATVGLSTHFHHDHVLWHTAFGDVPRWASAATVAMVDQPDLRVLDAAALPWDGPAAEVIGHDAHAVGHLAVWIPERGVLVAGDMLSDVELPLPDDEDDGLARYQEGLEALAPYASRAEVLVPGHGTVTTEPMARLDADRRYLDAVRSGRDPDDPRLTNKGMAEAHATNLRLAGFGP
jgi:glyoxylase-like metal-dependent hydrolase (beta-lactamase superfamily II)